VGLWCTLHQKLLIGFETFHKSERHFGWAKIKNCLTHFMYSSDIIV